MDLYTFQFSHIIHFYILLPTKKPIAKANNKDERFWKVVHLLVERKAG